MNFEGEAIVISVKKFSERDALVSIFSAEHGVYRSIVKGGLSKKQRGIWQAGNLVHVRWQARLSEQMGSIYGELLKPWAALTMSNQLKMMAISSTCTLMLLSLMERDAHPPLYQILYQFLQQTAESNEEDKSWVTYYALLELVMLTECGFGLDLSACAATGSTENLVYVSPKSGRAVSEEAGKPYHDKMLKLPAFILRYTESMEIDTDVGHDEIFAAFDLTGYFLEHWLLAGLHKKMPSERFYLYELLKSKIAV